MNQGNKTMKLAILTSISILFICPTPFAQNQAVSFDGSGDAVVIPNHPTLQSPTAFTLEYWVFFPNTQIGRVINKGDGIRGVTNRTYDFSYKSDPQNPARQIIEVLAAFSGSASTFVSAEVTPGSWNHIALTFSSAQGVLSLYVDGLLGDSTTTTDSGPLAGRTLRQSSLPLVIGGTPGFSVWDFEGSLDELRIWSVTRTQSEIQCTMNTTILAADLPSYPGLNSVLNFEGSLSDEAGINNGSFSGNATFAAADDIPFLALCGTMIADVENLSLSEGGIQQLNMDAGVANADRFYWMLGTASGTSPGFGFGTVNVPLNLDAYTLLLATRPAAAPFQSNVGVLDSLGVGHASFVLPSGADAGLAGITLDHAYLVFDAPGTVDFVSSPVSLALIP
jgi:hypothetical protein